MIKDLEKITRKYGIIKSKNEERSNFMADTGYMS